MAVLTVTDLVIKYFFIFVYFIFLQKSSLLTLLSSRLNIFVFFCFFYCFRSPWGAC
jgi:hypothetical protein